MSFRADIEAMQILSNEKLFHRAAKLIQEKWRQYKDNEIDDFISRFNIFQKEVTVGMKAIQWEFQAQATLVNTKAHEKTQRFNIKKIG